MGNQCIPASSDPWRAVSSVAAAKGARNWLRTVYAIMRNIIVPIGCNQQTILINSINISEDEPMKWLMTFNNLMDKKGATQFNDREYIKRDNNVCHFKIKRCVFKDFLIP